MKLKAEDIAKFVSQGFPGEESEYCFSFYAMKNSFELTQGNSDSADQIFNNRDLVELLEEYGEEHCPENAATGWLYVNVKTGELTFNVHTTHA
jgi:hypothetical protein